MSMTLKHTEFCICLANGEEQYQQQFCKRNPCLTTLLGFLQHFHAVVEKVKTSRVIHFVFQVSLKLSYLQEHRCCKHYSLCHTLRSKAYGTIIMWLLTLSRCRASAPRFMFCWHADSIQDILHLSKAIIWCSPKWPSLPPKGMGFQGSYNKRA